MFMIMLVLNDAMDLDSVLAGWVDAGATLITAVEGSGTAHPRSSRLPVHARYDVEHLSVETGEANLTLFGAVADEAGVERCQSATEAVVGDLTVSRSGVWAAWPLAALKGAAPGVIH